MKDRKQTFNNILSSVSVKPIQFYLKSKGCQNNKLVKEYDLQKSSYC